MAQVRHEQVMDIFNAAADLSPNDQIEFLKEACAGDTSLRADVESLLAHDSAARSPFDSPILGTGFNVTQAAHPDAARGADLPERIGPYRILGLLGAGSMGIVYRAQQEHPSRTVALKVMHPGRWSRKLHQRFQAEMASLARLRHPGIARFYHADTEQTPAGPRPYMAMELVEGRPLTAYVREKAIGIEARLDLLAKLCDAVQHAHQHGVIHRDLKPANVLVEESDDGPQPRILDFGVARITDLDVKTATMATEQGQLVGTLAYMSPEQVSADPHEIDTRSDIYALGVIGYEMLSGKLPIDVSGMSVFAALHAIKERIPPPLAVHDRRFRGDLSTLLNKALAKDKNLRYESAGGLAADIRNYLAHRPIMAHPPSLLYALRKLARRHRSATAVLLLAGLVATYGLIRAHIASVEMAAQYRETRDVASFLVGDFAASLDTIGGTIEVRRSLLKRMQTSIQSLLLKAPRDTTVLRAQADVLDRLSDIDFAEGSYNAALMLREQVLDIRRQLVVLSSGDPQRQADLSIAMVEMGDVLDRLREDHQVDSWYKQALDLDEQLAREHPQDRRLLDNLAHSCVRVSYREETAGRTTDAERLCNQALDIYKRLLVLFPDQLITRYGCWEAEKMLADLANQRGQRSLAEAHTNESLAYAQRLVAEAPDHRLFLAAYASSTYRAARYSMDKGNNEAVWQGVEEAFRVYDGIYKLDPLDGSAQDEYCYVLRNYASLLQGRGRFDEAYARAQEAAAIARALVDREPGQAGYAGQLASALWLISQASNSKEMPGEAFRAEVESLEISRQLAEREPPLHEHLDTYARHLLWPVLKELRDPVRALPFALRAVEVSDGLSAKYWYTLACCYRDVGDMAQARESCSRGLAVAPDEPGRVRDALCSLRESLEAVKSENP